MKKNDDIIIFSFYTKDEYYTKKAEELAESLDTLGLDYFLKPVEIPEGKEWPDICRDKIGYIKEFYDANPSKKVFWIDVDCQLSYLPDLVKDFSADIIGFQRGFQVPLKIGYHYKKRFWEPSFVGFNQTEAARKFIHDAFAMEQRFEGRATDDYFFEESWRANSPYLSFQLIPSGYAAIEGRARKVEIKPFFFFGSSGNVSTYVGKVVQHKTPWIKEPKGGYLDLDVKQSSKEFLKRVVPDKWKLEVKKLLIRGEKLDEHVFKKRAFQYGKGGESGKLQALIQSQGGYELLTPRQTDIVKLAHAFMYYQKNKKHDAEQPALRLAWWHLPEPGNYGDWLSPYILNKITGRKVEFANPQSKGVTAEHYFAVGSIGKFTKKSSIVLGTGISAKDAELNADADYRMVRGPYTRAQVLESGGSCPEVYGDPAVALPRLYMPAPSESDQNKDRLLLVRHFTNHPVDVLMPEDMDELSIFASHPKEIEAFIDTLHQYSGVVTSAMHCLITCQAYGIPCALVSFEGHEDSVHGDGIKYRDYQSGVGVREHDPLTIPADLRRYDLRSILSTESIDEAVIDRVYKTLVSELGKRPPA